MIIRELDTRGVGSQQTRAARDCSVPHAKSRPSKTYSILLSERDAARLRRPSPRSDALSSGQRLSIEPDPSARTGISVSRAIIETGGRSRKSTHIQTVFSELWK